MNIYKLIGKFRDFNGKYQTYSFYADDPFEFENRANEIAQSFGWELLTYEEVTD